MAAAFSEILLPHTPAQEANLWDVRETPTLVATQVGTKPEFQAYLRDKGVQILELEAPFQPLALAQVLYERGFQRCFWECGGTLAAPAIDQGVLHKVLAFVAPKLVRFWCIKYAAGCWIEMCACETEREREARCCFKDDNCIRTSASSFATYRTIYSLVVDWRPASANACRRAWPASHDGRAVPVRRSLGSEWARYQLHRVSAGQRGPLEPLSAPAAELKAGCVVPQAQSAARRSNAATCRASLAGSSQSSALSRKDLTLHSLSL